MCLQSEVVPCIVCPSHLKEVKQLRKVVMTWCQNLSPSLIATICEGLVGDDFDFIHPPRSIPSLLLVALFKVDTIDAYIYCTH